MKHAALARPWRFLAVLVTASALGLWSVGVAQAQGYGTGAPSGSTEWAFQGGLYLFAPGIQGDVGVRNVTAEADVGFDQIWDSLDKGFMGFAEASRGDISLVVDVAYLKLQAEGPRASNRGFVQATLDQDFEQTVAAGYLAYTVIDHTINAGSDVRKFSLDAIAGARYNRLDIDLGLNVAGLRQSGSVSASRTEDWVDPVIGLRATYVPLRPWFVSGWLDYGGFGVGADST